MSTDTTGMVQCLRGPMDGATIHPSQIKRGKLKIGIVKNECPSLIREGSKASVWGWWLGRGRANAIAVYKRDMQTGHLVHVKMESPK
jgi:hypothetical protein